MSTPSTAMTPGKKALCGLALLLPYLGLCFPGLYARTTPALFGFPFFYWYQLAAVAVTSALLAGVYRLLRRPQQEDKKG